MARHTFADFTARCDSGEVLFSEGDPGSTLFVIQSGIVELVADDGNGGEVLAVMEKGDFFGEMSLLEGTARPYTARVAESASIIEISAPLFDRMIRSNIELAVRMLRKLSLRLGEAEGRLAGLRQGAAPQLQERQTTSAAAPEKAATATTAASPAPAAASSTAAARPTNGDGTIYLVNPSGNEAFPLTEKTVRVGRFDPVTGTRPEVDLTLLDLKRSVSRRHAVFTMDNGELFLTEEVGALNGTLVNGEALTTGTPARVAEGDELGFGSVILRLQDGCK